MPNDFVHCLHIETCLFVLLLLLFIIIITIIIICLYTTIYLISRIKTYANKKVKTLLYVVNCGKKDNHHLNVTMAKSLYMVQLPNLNPYLVHY